MKVVILDESHKRSGELVEAIKGLGHEPILCHSSSDFIDSLAQKPGYVLMDVLTWFNGTSIYRYHRVGEKLAEFPVVFYNAIDGFSNVEGRHSNSSDKVLRNDCRVEEIVAPLR